MAIPGADQAEILSLMARYNWAFDTGDPASWSETFTEDGYFEALAGVFRGREELARYCREATSGRGGGHFSSLGRQHWTGNVDITGDGDVAHGRCYRMMVRRGADGSGSVDRMGWYEDDFRRIDGQWLFSRRRVREVATPH
jgi:SnoaL-like domain